LVHEKFNYYYNNKDVVEDRKKIFKNIDFFICISNKTKEDFLDLYRVPENKVKVIHLGCDHMQESCNDEILFNSINFKQKYNIVKPFILYVGRRSKYKNFNSLINAYSNSNNIVKNFDIVCFGGEKFSQEEISYFKKLKIDKNLHYFFGRDSDLKQFYLNAKVMVATSKYEGFGLPLVEAMSLKCRLLVNDIQIFREICGNNAIYFQNEEDLSHKLEQILFLDEDNDSLDKIKIDTIEKFTWKKTAEKTIKIYNLLQK
jgi:glycosyltransferase involved in cell wall biosynthesis